jgi:hypothetical protein
MSLERKDVRFKMDPDMHRALALVCELDHQDLGEFVEALVLEKLKRRMHDAMVLAAELQRLGIAGNAFPGKQ